MSPQDDSARDPVRPHAERWVAESPFIGEAAEEQVPSIHPWYQAHTPFREEQELEKTYGPEAEWESDPAALEAESPFRRVFEQGRMSLIEPEEPEEEFVMEEESPLQHPSWQPLSLSQTCQEKLKNTSVAVVGGGLAGLMAARRLGQHGVKVTVFEARPQVGGRVLSNKTFSNGRITEEGAELIGSFHTTWLALAREYGLAVISRMDKDLYERAGLDMKLTLDKKKLSMDEIRKLDKAMETRILEPIARDAGQISHQSQPWLEPWLEQYDKMSVADALVHRYGVKRDERLWKMIEFKLVNDEVAPLDEMNFLGLLCKVRSGQDARFSSDDDIDDLKERVKRRLMRYWNELEIFRCADGSQTLATKMADEIQTKKYGATLLRSTAVTNIHIHAKGVLLGYKKVVNDRKGTLADGLPSIHQCDYVILAIPPSVWAGVTITAGGTLPADGKKVKVLPSADGKKVKKVNLDQEVGKMGMNPAVKCFSDVKKRFWIEEKPPAAPSGGSLALGQVWEGTDNQTRVGKQGIVLSVFAGPIIADRAGRRAPTRDECKEELRNLYPGYTDDNLNKKEPLFSDWPSAPFIKTGYSSPRKGEIFTIAQELNKPFLDRLFFAGEHTQMDYFGYMEGALRSGERAAHTLILKACGLLKQPAPTSSKPPVITASAAPIRARTASEYEAEIPLEEHSSPDYPGEAESPFLHQELLVGESEEEWEPRTAALESESSGTIAEPEFGELYEFDDSEVSDNLTADAFVADNNGRRYFVTFPQLGDLAVKKATILTPSDFENLMDLMLASNQKNFVIDAHGEPKGLFMPLASGTKIPATKNALFILSGIEYIRSLIRIAKESETFWGRASGTDIDRWRRIVEVLHSETWQRMVGPGWPTLTPQVSSVDAAKSIVQSRINALVDSLFPGKVANRQDRVDRLIKKMLRLQAKGIREIQFRACNIGKDPNTLHEFRRFFGADHLCAPDVRSGMGLSDPPSIDRRAVDLLGRDRRTQLFNMPSGRFAIRIIISGASFSVNCAADTQATVGEWVANHIMANSTYRRGKLPIHFLQTQPLVFPLDSDYAAHIRCRSSFWESVVRGSKLEGEEAPEEELDWQMADSGEEESERDEEEPAEAFELAEEYHEVDRFDPLGELDADEQLLSAEPELDALAFEALGSDDEHVSDEGAGLQSEASGPRAEVRALQESINKWRVENGQTPIKEDGLLSAETNKAVLEFQKASGLKRRDGIAGLATRERLTLLLDILKNISSSSGSTGNRLRLVGLVGSAGFRSLKELTQTEVLKRILSYQRSPGALEKISRLTNLVTQTGFELLPTSSQELMLRALSARPDDAYLTVDLRQLADSPGFRNLEEPTQTWVLKRIEGYAGNRTKIDNLENLITATNNFDQLSKESRNVMLVALAYHPRTHSSSTISAGLPTASTSANWTSPRRPRCYIES